MQAPPIAVSSAHGPPMPGRLPTLPMTARRLLVVAFAYTAAKVGRWQRRWRWRASCRLV
ncbi:MAG: hypothetical protein MZV64_62320 [Ignavibacteriales bacterium]|nr:hypothetical protein [Ignavibacteriales bacterium]